MRLRNSHPELLMLSGYRRVTDQELDALSDEIRRTKDLGLLSTMTDLKSLSLDKRLAAPPKAKASRASSSRIYRGLPQRTRR